MGPLVSRRQLFGVAGAIAAAAVAPRLFTDLPWVPTPAYASESISPSGAVTGGTSALRLDRFTPLVGSEMTFTTGAVQHVTVTLVEATELRTRAGNQRPVSGEAFSLIFAGAGGKRFEDGVYRISHPALGTVELFVAAVDRAKRGQRYQAIVNRRAPAR